jgi:hypothetical protein
MVVRYLLEVFVKYKNGEEVKLGDVIRWNFWYSDDFKTWIFTGLVKTDGVLYLGGGIDFGLAIGDMYSYDDVIAESENNDSVGIEKVGVASDLERYIAKFNT